MMGLLLYLYYDKNENFSFHEDYLTAMGICLCFGDDDLFDNALVM